MTDQATAALIKDLKQRGLLDDTLVVWGGEFGRTPMVESNGRGRRRARSSQQGFHDVARGRRLQSRAHLGRNGRLRLQRASKTAVHVHDLHATILHLLGFDHTKLTYRFQGRDFRLTDVHGNVVQKLLA